MSEISSQQLQYRVRYPYDQVMAQNTASKAHQQRLFTIMFGGQLFFFFLKFGKILRDICCV